MVLEVAHALTQAPHGSSLSHLLLRFSVCAVEWYPALGRQPDETHGTRDKRDEVESCACASR
jgi:hypothetical protein